MALPKKYVHGQTKSREDKVREIMTETFCTASEASRALSNAGGKVSVAIHKVNNTEPAKDEAVLPVEDVEVTYHLAEKPKQPAKLLSVADPKERKEMAAQPYRTKDDEVKPVSPKYNAEAVQKEINKDKRIGGKEAKLIHSLLKGRTGDAEELILWGVPKGKKDQLHAQILYTQAKSSADVERVKAAASKDGWHSFRVQKLNTKEDPSNMFGKKSLARDMLKPVGDVDETTLLAEYDKLGKRRGMLTSRIMRSPSMGRGANVEPEIAKAVKEAEDLLSKMNAIAKQLPANIRRKMGVRDASPFDRDTDVGSAMQILVEMNNGHKAKDIAAKYGYSLQFVLDVGNGKFGKNAAAIKKAFKGVYR
jgi:hypothetical protein